MILTKKDGIKYLHANYHMVNLIKQGHTFMQFIDIPRIRPHHLAKGTKLSDYIKEQGDLIDVFMHKANEHKQIRDKLIEVDNR